MRILWVKANKLLPVSSGGDIRSYNIARRLACSHDTIFVSYYDGPKDPDYESELRRHFPSALAFSTGTARGMVERGMDYLNRVTSGIPYAVSRFEFPAVRESLDRCFASQRVDVAVCDFLDAAINFPARLNIPSILFQHNVESEIWRRHWLTQSNPLKRVVYQLEYRRMLAYEKGAIDAFHHIVAVSEHDAKLMRSMSAGASITVVPTGVDVERFRPNPQPRVAAPLVVFVGAMDWEPNVDAVTYFCREMWPKILLHCPEARFRIVGRNPDRRITKLQSETVQVSGFVSSVLEHLHEATVVVVPLRVGGGTRLKIYEAMATGKAVVSTSIGAEGLDVHSGKDILLADDPNSFSAAVLRLLNDPQLRRRYETSAAELAANYDWSVIATRFEKVLASVCGSGAEGNLGECETAKVG